MGRVIRVGLVAAGVAAVGILSGGLFAQGGAQAPAAQGAWMSAPPTNDAPNPYNTIEGWAKLPEGRAWGSTSAVEIDKDGRSIWVAERCAGQIPAGIPRRSRCRPLDHGLQVRLDRQAGDELRAGHDRLPARHPRRSRRQHLGDRRPGQPAAPPCPGPPPMRRCRPRRKRSSAIRCSSSAPTARCC